MTTVSSLFSKVSPLFSGIAETISGEVDCSFETLSLYARDASSYYIQPQAVIYPKNATDIKHILAFARELKMPVTVRGLGNGEHGGCLSEGIILDLHRHFNQIRHINMLEQTVTVDAGVSVAEFIKKLHTWQFDIPCLDEFDTTASVGAYVATRSISSSSFHYGSVRDWIEGVRVVVDNGEEHNIADGITPSGRLLGIYQSVFPLLSSYQAHIRANKPTTEEASGYSVWNTTIGPRQLIDEIVGSEGTLGIITSITFRVTTYKPFSQVTCIPIENKDDIPHFIELAKNHRVERMFLYDHIFMELSKRYSQHHIPYFKDASYVLMTVHTHTDKEKLKNLVKTFHHALPHGEEASVLASYDVFERLLSPTFIQEVSKKYSNNVLSPLLSTNGLLVKPNKIPSLLRRLEHITDSTGKMYTVSGFVGSGHLAITPLFDLYSNTHDTATTEYTHAVFESVKKEGGSFSALGGDGLTKTPHLPQKYNETMLTLFKEIKNAWDPLGILNPGKKLGTSFHYLSQRIVKNR